MSPSLSGVVDADRSSQLLKGVLDMCLLALLSDEPGYGYELARTLTRQGLELANEGTIYPALSRLQRRGLVEGYLVESPEGPARKYYRITPKGRSALGSWVSEWERLVEATSRILRGGEHG